MKITQRDPTQATTQFTTTPKEQLEHQINKKIKQMKKITKQKNKTTKQNKQTQNPKRN